MYPTLEKLTTLATSITIINDSAIAFLTANPTPTMLGPEQAATIQLQNAPLLYIQSVRRTITSAINTTIDPKTRTDLITLSEQIDALLNTNNIKLAP